MPNLSIKDVPEAWAEALRQRASRSHRSLQGELMAIIERALQEELTAAAGVVGFDRLGHPITRRGTRTIEEIAADNRKRFPEPIRGVPLAVDIIRAERDSR
jgi:plasmid stability protein